MAVSGECAEEMRKEGIIDDKLITFSSNQNTANTKLNGEPWSPETTDSQPFVSISFPTKARVTAIQVQGGPDGYVENFEIEFKDSPGDFKFIRSSVNNEIMVRNIHLSSGLSETLD